MVGRVTIPNNCRISLQNVAAACLSKMENLFPRIEAMNDMWFLRIWNEGTMSTHHSLEAGLGETISRDTLARL